MEAIRAGDAALAAARMHDHIAVGLAATSLSQSPPGSGAAESVLAKTPER
jgi:DNA-binding GntR family transcriptional regulator